MAESRDEAVDADDPPASRVVAWVSRAKRHPAIVVIGVALAISAAIGTVLQLPKVVVDSFAWFGTLGAGPETGLVGPPSSDEPTASSTVIARLSDIRLGMTRDALAATLGQPLETEDVACDALGCDAGEWPDLEFAYYDLGKAELRALFDNDDLAFYAVTLVDASPLEGIQFLGWQLGTLGEMTYAGAYSALPELEPTAFEIFLGAQRTAYAEAFTAGAMSDYQGFYLANGPSGYGGWPFAREEAGELSGSAGEGSPELAAFREGTVPNTFGEFESDGIDLPGYLDGNLVSMLFQATPF